MSSYQQPTSAANGRGRIVLAALASLLLLGSLVFFVLAGVLLSHAREKDTGSGAAAAQFRQMASTVEASIATQAKQAAEQRSEAAHHEVDDPADPPPAAERPAIAGVERVVTRWLLGYLPYEVDQLTTGGRRDLEATSTTPLARSLLSNPPLIPSTGQRPREGRTVDLITTFASGGRTAYVYTEIAYGVEQIGFHLTLRRGGQFGWLVAGFHA